jgi:transcriptional regulator with XRE-family HTH domain
MDLATFRKQRDLSLEECAKELGLSPSSKGWLSEIEAKPRKRDASLKLAMKIERWSGGQVKAASVCKIAAEVAGQAMAE